MPKLTLTKMDIMIKNLSQLEVVVSEKVGRFMVDIDTSTAIAKEMCVQFLNFIGKVEEQALANALAQKELEKNIEVSSEPQPEAPIEAAPEA